MFKLHFWHKSHCSPSGEVFQPQCLCSVHSEAPEGSGVWLWVLVVWWVTLVVLVSSVTVPSAAEPCSSRCCVEKVELWCSSDSGWVEMVELWCSSDSGRVEMVELWCSSVSGRVEKVEMVEL